jgi:hypothetical protein
MASIICFPCDAALNSADRCCGGTSGGCCSSIERCFGKAFSCALCGSFLCALIPAIVMLIIVSYNKPAGACGHPLFAWVVVALTVLLADFLLAIYVFLRMNCGTTNASQTGSGYGYPNTRNILCYDAVVGFWVILTLFTIAWCIVGHIWSPAHNLTAASTCDANGTFYRIYRATLAFAWIMVGLTILTFLISYCSTIDEQVGGGVPFMWKRICCCLPQSKAGGPAGTNVGNTTGGYGYGQRQGAAYGTGGQYGTGAPVQQQGGYGTPGTGGGGDNVVVPTAPGGGRVAQM